LKKASLVLLSVTVIFLSAMVGYHIGKNYVVASFTVSAEKPIGKVDTEDAGTFHPLDINTATVEELDLIPGIGQSTAEAIVDYRTKNGPYKCVEDLLKIPGIGQAKLDSFKHLITAGG